MKEQRLYLFDVLSGKKTPLGKGHVRMDVADTYLEIETTEDGIQCHLGVKNIDVFVAAVPVVSNVLRVSVFHKERP